MCKKKAFGAASLVGLIWNAFDILMQFSGYILKGSKRLKVKDTVRV